MVKVTVIKNTKRETVITEASKTPVEIAEQAKLFTPGTSIWLNGKVISNHEAGECSIERLGVADGDECTLAMVQKAESAQ